MCQMNVLEAKTNFSKIIAMLERKEEKEVIIARAGKPVVKMTLLPINYHKRLYYDFFINARLSLQGTMLYSVPAEQCRHARISNHISFCTNSIKV